MAELSQVDSDLTSIRLAWIPDEVHSWLPAKVLGDVPPPGTGKRFQLLDTNDVFASIMFKHLCLHFTH
jgi:hypothetical protein